MSKILSVGVPCYNSQDYMAKCIDSLLAGGPDVEIIIVDDGSKDDTARIADDYQSRYPDIVKVIHQPNKGHGGALNSAMAAASGAYFFVVDSDDWLDAKTFPNCLEALRQCQQQGGVDLLVANYIYQHQDITKNRHIGYQQVFPHGKICTWSQTHFFAAHQYLTLHTNIYRTAILKESGLVLPEHVFYEDNLFAYYPLAWTKKIYYLNEPLYHYVVDRDGQSVAADILVKRYRMQIAASIGCFTAFHIGDFKEEQPKLAAYMYHELTMMMTIGSLFARLSNESESEADFENMWKQAEAFDKPVADRVRNHSMAWFVSRKGAFGRGLARFAYKFAHVFIQFN